MGDPLPSVAVIHGLRLARDAIVGVIEASARFSAVCAYETHHPLLRSSDTGPFDLALLDLPTSQGPSAIEAVRFGTPATRVVVSGLPPSPEMVIACARAGASGYVEANATDDDWVIALTGALRGEVHAPRIAGVINQYLGGRVEHPTGTPQHPSSWNVPRHVVASAQRAKLSPRERQIVALIDRGLSNKEIANELCVELSTIKNHVHSILGKYRVRRRSEAAARFRASDGSS